MTTETLALIAAYCLCSEAAALRVLDRVEYEACAALYIEVKLSFLPDVTPEDYHAMSAPERAVANRRGYMAYMHWRATHPAIVRQMEAEARRHLFAHRR